MATPIPELDSAILDALDSGVIVLDRAGRISVWNAWIAAASGRGPDAACGKRLEEVFPDARLERVRIAVRDALELGTSSLLSHQLNGSPLPLSTRGGRRLVHAIVARPVGAKPYAHCLLQILDVTVTTEREKVLRERQNARYDAVVGSATDPIVTLDAEGLIQSANPAAVAAFGAPAASLIGSRFADWLDDAAPWREAWGAVIDGRSFAPVELAIRNRRGGLGFVEATAGRWLSQGRLFVTAILRDVDERRGAAEALRRLNESLEERVLERTSALERAHEQLRQSQKMEAIGQLTGGVAHDFNNLLTPIIGGLDMLQRSPGLDARGGRLIDGALQSAERARVLVQRLLAFARRQPLQCAAVGVAELISEMTDLISGAIGPQVKIVVDAPQGLPPAYADRNQVEMALLNLAVNARDAMPDGGVITISCRMSEVAAGAKLTPGRYVRLAVTDTGVGMDAVTLARAVEPFFSTKSVGKGTGLGLSMIHGLCAQLGGVLELSSTPGVGTRVEMWLPAFEGDVAQAAARAEGAMQMGEGLVLLVDDEDLVRNSTAQMLTDLGFSVAEARSAQEALERAEDPRIGLVVTDHLMPGATGAELARQLKSRRPGLPVLIMSGYAELEAIAPDLPRLLKPFRESELAAALAALLPAG